MSTTTDQASQDEAQEPAETPQGVSEAPPGVTEPTDQAQEAAEPQEADTSGNKEAAKYRTRLRDAEAERDTLTAQLDAARRHIVTQAADLGNAAPLLFEGTDVGEFFTDDGTLDAEKVAAAAREVRETYGLPRAPKPDPNQGRTVPVAAPSFAEAFRPKHR